VRSRQLGKFSLKFYGSFKILQRICAVAYKLNLPTDASIHLVFHVSCQKAKMGQTITPIPTLPLMDRLGHLAPKPSKVLEQRTAKHKKHKQVTEMLEQWEGATVEDATWELLYKL
jgi:hypothetical protein